MVPRGSTPYMVGWLLLWTAHDHNYRFAYITPARARSARRRSAATIDRGHERWVHVSDRAGTALLGEPCRLQRFVHSLLVVSRNKQDIRH